MSQFSASCAPHAGVLMIRSEDTRFRWRPGGRIARYRPLRALGTVGLLWSLGACALVGVTADPPAPPAAPAVLEAPPIREGLRDVEEAMTVAELVTEGESLLAEGDPAGAAARAREVEVSYPEAEGSSLALWLLARASRELEDWDEGITAIDRFAEILPEEDNRFGEAMLLRAELRRDAGAPGGVEALFEIPPDAGPEVLERADEVAAAWGREMDTAVLRDLVREAPPHPRILPVFLVELSVRRQLAGAEGEARQLAEEALELSPGEGMASRATAVLEGRVEDELAVSAVLGAILPESGSPSVRQLSREIRDGIEVALVVDEGNSASPARLSFVDDAGDASRVAQAISNMEQDGVVGIVGPLLDPLVEAAGQARSGSLVILSPTARMLPEGADGLFSLTAVDPEAGRALAELVIDQGVRSVVVIHASSPEMAAEARWFREAFESSGGSIRQTFSYEPGAASIQAPLREVVRTRPSGLVLLMPQDDIPRLAPQIAYYGVDDLPDLRLFGGESWSSESILDGVPPRHTDGVFSVTSRSGSGEFGPGWDGFVVAYEEHFRRTLRSPMPALGYDAARLLLTAARLGGGTPEGTRRALEEMENFPGATGLLSVRDGRIQRVYVPVRLQDRRMIPLSP